MTGHSDSTDPPGPPIVSVIIPTLNEAELLPGLLADLALVDCPLEIIVSDGGSLDETAALARTGGARVVHARQGRGPQLNAGAAEARSDWLCFLHADVRVPAEARCHLERVLEDQRVQAAVWRLAIDAEGWWYRVVELGAKVRDRLGGLPYGDQGLLIRCSFFEELGGFPDYPVMEDVALSRAIQRNGTLTRLPSPLLVSARRWKKEGPARNYARNIGLISAYLAGVSPHTLARWYPNHSP
jgi:rSAM/selenodomain-associated transferase 2